MNHRSTETLASSDGACSDGAAMKPCRILLIPVHNAGPITATLTWDQPGVDLDLTFFQTGTSTPIAESRKSGSGPERIATSIDGGATYEFRVTWSQGTGSAQYVLEVTYPY
jgi:hypothetical protein